MNPLAPILILAMSLPIHLSAASDLRIEKRDGSYRITAREYTAQVDADGALASLVIEGVEFIAPPTEVAQGGQTNLLPGLFASPMHQWYKPFRLTSVTEQRDNVIRCEGKGWKLEYAFQPDAIELAYEGEPEGQRGFKAGYPPAELTLRLAHDLDRACDPEQQGELGWPVTRKHEPGNFAVLAKNGAGFIAENGSWFNVVNGVAAAPPHRLDLLVFNTYDQSPGPVRRRLKIFRKADLAHSVTMEITSPNRHHMFSGTNDVVFPVKVRALYGQSLEGAVAFQGAPYVWKKPELTSKTPVSLGADKDQTVRLAIRPPKPGHYTGLVSVTDGAKPIYNKRIGFLYQPEQIPSAEPPADFDRFWDSTLAELEKAPLDLTLEERTDLETTQGRVFKAKYRSWAGRWAWAWLYVPKAEGKVPAKMWLPPVSVWQPPKPQPADGSLRIMVAIHGGDLKDYPAKPDFDYMNTGITNREAYMLRYSYCCLVRCFDILKNHPSCNGEIEIEGSSQGAGLSLVLTGLRNAKSARGMAVALCRIDWTVLGHTQWGPACPPGEDPQKIAEVVRYYDPANFAHRIRTPLRLAFGLFDFCAPAEGIFTALNALPKDTPCEIFVDPYAGHFTIDLADFHKGQGILEVPRWHGSAEENKLMR